VTKGLTERKIYLFNWQHVRLYHSLTFEPQVGISDNKSKRSKKYLKL